MPTFDTRAPQPVGSALPVLRDDAFLRGLGWGLAFSICGFWMPVALAVTQTRAFGLDRAVLHLT